MKQTLNIFAAIHSSPTPMYHHNIYSPTPMYHHKITWKERLLDWALNRYRCQFCRKACHKYAMYSDAEFRVHDVYTAVIWVCPPCKASYYINWENKLQSITLETDIKLITYQFHLNLVKNTSCVWKKGVSFGLSFPYIVKVTPQNINQKLRTLLTFS